MSETSTESGLKVVDAHDLPEEVRFLLRPGEMVKDRDGRRHRLPRYFYEIPSYEEAKDVQLSPNFRLHEFVRVDLREADRLQQYPRYVPCAIRIMASVLQRIRDAIGSSLHISVNGAYRSPAHERNVPASPHMWGTAVDLYRIGNSMLQTEDLIRKFGAMIEDLTGEIEVSSYGHEPPLTDDHLHIDLGYLIWIPRQISEDRMELPQEKPRFAFEERRLRDRRAAPEPEKGEQS